MHADQTPTFYYHANASALGGVLRQPIERAVSTRAALSLPQAGGFASSRVQKFHVDGLVSCEAAHVSVSGNRDKERGGWRTTATATVERLNILEVVTADRIVSQVSVTHPEDGGFAEISFNGSQFVNLRVNGEPAHPLLDRRFFGARPPEREDQEKSPRLFEGVAPRFSDLLQIAERQYVNGLRSRQDLLDRLGKRFAFAEPEADIEKKGSFLCSLVEQVETEAPVERCGHIIHIPDFGNVFLGEMLVGRFSAQLTMLRVEMGCIASGDLSACTAFSNGSTMP